MNPDFPRVPRSSSRPHRDQRGVVLPTRIMLVAIVVVALAAAMYVATSPGGSKQASPEPAGSTSTPAAEQTSSAPASPTATPNPSASGSTWLTPTPSATAKAKATASPSATPSPQVASPTRAVRRGATFVEVFNNTKRKGLANRTANRAKGVGWKVVGSDNWYGTIPTTTVYYPKGMGQAAKALARDLGIGRVKPTIAPMRSDRLTVILTSDFRLSRA